MDPIEKAIRNAFAKGDAADRAFREKVYRSAFAALDRALQANPGITVETAIKRRKTMQARIAEIEAGFLSAVPVIEPEGTQDGAVAPAVEAPSLDTPTKASVPTGKSDPAMGGGRMDPTLSGPARADPGLSAPGIVPEPVLAGSPPGRPGAATQGGVEVSPDRDRRRAAGRRRPYGLLVGLLLLAVVAAAAWWALEGGLLQAPQPTGGGSVSTQDAAPSSGGAAGPVKPDNADRDRNWITVFTPGDPTSINAPADASAEVMQDDTGSFVRVRSGASGSPIGFDVGQGILEKLTGRHAVFDILARSEEGKETQMSVDCDFGDMGECGRKRYAVGHERREYLFDATFPQARAGAGGVIAVNPDFDKQGKAIDIYEIRVSVDD